MTARLAWVIRRDYAGRSPTRTAGCSVPSSTGRCLTGVPDVRSYSVVVSEDNDLVLTSPLAADRLATRPAGALIGLPGAVGALGGVGVNLAFWQSLLTLKTGDGACLAFTAFYAICCATDLVFLPAPALEATWQGSDPPSAAAPAGAPQEATALAAAVDREAAKRLVNACQAR